MALKRTTEEVAKYFEEQGCKLMDEYTGCMEPMEYQCKCGQYSEISWNNFTKGKRCGYCTKWGQKKKRSLEQVRKIFLDRGCEFLDDEFKGVNYNHNYRCKCGRIAVISFAGFYHQNQNCFYCGLEKNKKEKHHSWKSDRVKHRLEQLFRKKCYKALSSTLLATGKMKVGHTSDMLGYGPKELQIHITNHPNWNSVKDGNWHIDHIFPVVAFLEHGITDVKLINNLENLRPISQHENNIKHAKYDKEEFEKWLQRAQYENIQ